MGTLTTKKLGATVGAEVLGSTRTACWTTTTCRRRAWRRSRRTASWCSASSTSTTRPRSPSPSGSTTSARPSRRLRPAIFTVTLDPTKSGHWPSTCAGPSTGTSTARRTTSRRRRRCSARHVISATGGETEFASTYAAYDDLDRCREEALRGPARPPLLRGLAAPGPPRPHARTAGGLALEAGQGASAGLAAPLGPPLPGHRRHRRRTWSAWTVDEGKALLDELLERSTAPARVYRHEWTVGDLIIWDNTGVMHRVTPLRPGLRPRDAPHDHERRRADPSIRQETPMHE